MSKGCISVYDLDPHDCYFRIMTKNSVIFFLFHHVRTYVRTSRLNTTNFIQIVIHHLLRRKIFPKKAYFVHWTNVRRQHRVLLVTAWNALYSTVFWLAQYKNLLFFSWSAVSLFNEIKNQRVYKKQNQIVLLQNFMYDLCIK